jgi:alpha-1,3-rhamnosyltransferase
MNLNQPLVSVIIPSYNHEKYVEQAIMSVVSQTYKNIELIIIDDGSKDKSPYLINELINRVDSSKIIFEIQNNMGLCKTLNKAIRMANGEFIAILASDDMYLPNRIEECVNVLLTTKANVCAVYSDGFMIDENGKKIGKYSDKFKVPLSKNTYKELLLRDWIPALSVLYRKSSLLECGLFDENIEIEDYDMLLRLAQKFKFKYIPKLLFLYRLHGSNYSSDGKKMDEQLDLIVNKYKDLYSYKNYKLALINKNFIELLHEFNLLNIELTFREIIYKAQRKIGRVPKLLNMNSKR